MKKILSRRTFKTHLVLAACALSGVVVANAQDAKDAKKEEKKEEAASEDSGEEPRNWIEVGVGGNFIHGNSGAFQHRTGQPRDIWGGVTDFHYEQDVGKKGLFEVDGRGIFDAHNYSLQLRLSDPDKGYVKAGYQEFSTYYAGSGGYFPLNVPANARWFNPTAEVMEINRNKAWFEAGLTLENKPQVRFRYSYETRQGFKPSTVWGDTTRTGAPAAPSTNRKIVPSFWAINEDRQNMTLDVSHTIKATELGVGGRFDFSKTDDAKYIHRFPGQNTGTAVDRWTTDREGVKADLFSVHAWSESDLAERVKLTTGYAFTTMDTDIFGSRAIGATPNASPTQAALQAFAGRQARDHGFDNLGGGAQMEQHIGTINLMYRPTDHLTLVPSIRFEDQGQNGYSTLADLEVGTTAARTVTRADVFNTRKRGFLDVTESFEARYTGVTNWVFYGRAELLTGSGRLSENETDLDDGTVPILRTTESERVAQKYVLGANWYPLRKLNLAGQYYHRVVDNDYGHPVDNTGTAANLYPAFIREQRFVTDDLNFRVTLRPVNNVTLVSRYDLTYQTIDTTTTRTIVGPPTALGPAREVQSADRMAHIFTESVTWFPIPRLFLQLFGSYTIDELRSPANFVAPRVEVSRNNYYTAGAGAGFALSEKTDVNADYSFYLADNYSAAIAATGLPLNAGLEDHMVGAGVVHRFSKRLQLSGRYSFMTSHDELAGGNNDFDAHMLSTTLRFRF